MAIFQTFIVNQAISFVVPMVAGYLKPYLTTGAEAAICGELKSLVAKVPAAEQGYATTAVNALASAWGV